MTNDRDDTYTSRLEARIEREFRGYGRALRKQYDNTIPGEPYMSMEDAKELVRRAVVEFCLKSKG